MAEQPQRAFGPGTFMWHELLTHDVARAKDFYTKVIGWTYQPWGGDPSGGYELIDPGNRTEGQYMVGGIMALSGPQYEGVPSHWAHYIDVEDVDASARRVQELGGKIANPPQDIPNGGRFCVIADPSGAHVNLLTPMEHATRPPTMGPRTFLWVELLSRDFARASAFYCELLGWTMKDMPMADGSTPEGKYTLFQKNGIIVCGGMLMPGEVPAEVPSHWAGYIHVPDVDRAVEAVKANGGQAPIPIMEAPGVGRFTRIIDPTGAVVELMTPAMPS